MSDDLILPEQSPSDLRQQSRMDAIPELYRKKHEMLAVELALAMDDADAIFAQHGYTPEQAAELVESPAFCMLLERVSKEVRENGLSFKSKVKVIAEELLPYALMISQDPQQSAAVRADLIKWTAKMAGHDPVPAKDDGKTGGGLTLSITFAGQEPQRVVSSHEPLTIEQGE